MLHFSGPRGGIAA